MLDLLKERLSDNFVSRNSENMNIPVVLKDMCVVLKKRVLICQVKDEAKAMFSLWRYASKEMPVLFISTKRNTATLLKKVIEEVFGINIDDIEMRKSSSFAGFGSFLDDFSEKKIYINDSTQKLDEKSIKDMIITYDIRVIVTDSSSDVY